MLICICKKAAKDICDVCPKFKLLKPDFRFNNPTWRRDLSDIMRRITYDQAE